MVLTESRRSRFRDREDACDSLVRLLEDLKGKTPVVLAIPRGAVPMSRRIADALGGTLDVVLVKKIGHPRSPEFAVAAVDENGEIFLSEGASAVGVSPAYLDREAERIRGLLVEARERYTGGRPPLEVRGKDVLLVDDGIATGATMLSAVRAIRGRSPRSITVACPVVSASARNSLWKEGAEVRALHIPKNFGSVGQYYDSFPQVEDEEVVRALGSST